MSYLKLLKYGLRFIFLQTLLTGLTIFFFDNYLIKDFEDAGEILINNLVEDRDRFYPFVTNDFIKIDTYLGIFILLFLIILYSTKFYTYVDELSFKFDSKYLDDFFNLYLLWTCSLMIFFTLIRFTILSRAYLIIFTFLIPIILLLFRNSEIISAFFGRSVTSENCVLINVSEDSTFRNLKIISFRRVLKELSFSNSDIKKGDNIISNIDTLNKDSEINLIVLNLREQNSLPIKLEKYLINLNKKILLISTNEMKFKNYFIFRKVSLQNSYLTYFNNDIQYGGKFIIKRVLDLIISFSLILLLSPLILLLSLYIIYLDGYPILIKQDRVGLHGKQFKMYKFRTMRNNAHELRDDLSDMNKHNGPLFKIKNDPRIIPGTEFMRNLSLDELPQLINAIKGNMSMVGPRPLFKEDTKLFDENYMRRLNVLPGITGLLQINERNTPDFDIWYKYDIEYIDNWSIYSDIKIILKTPASLFRQKTKGL
jgi:lipopolysaccharide/colanic/teichoic acid biosynthesis glycosyltransferase